MTTHTTHTPGPFVLGEPFDLSPTDRESYEVWEVRPLTAPSGDIVALLLDTEANPADAALFKAAPALLAALEAALEFLEANTDLDEPDAGDPWTPVQDRIDKARAAIAQARGEQ